MFDIDGYHQNNMTLCQEVLKLKGNGVKSTQFSIFPSPLILTAGWQVAIAIVRDVDGDGDGDGAASYL